MESTKLFNQIFDNFPVVSSIRVWDECEEFKLIGWQNTHIYICNLARDQLLNPMTISKLHCCYEELVSSDEVIDIVKVEDKYFILDSHCFISELVQEDLQDVEWDGDLFDESPKELLKCTLKRKCLTSKDSSLLSACLLPESVALLINTEQSVIVKIINLQTFKEIRCCTVRNTPLTILRPHQCVCLMVFVPRKEIEDEFIKNWFPMVQLDNYDSGLLLVSLPECIICGLFLDEINLSPHYLFSWSFQAISTKWLHIENEDPERIPRTSNLICVFDGGALLNLGQYGGKTAYLPLNKVRAANITSNFIIASDYFDCYSINFHDNEEITNLPVKGILGFCSIPGKKDIILATSKHRTLYAINLHVKVVRDDFKLPNVEVFDDYVRRCKYLDELSQQIIAKDCYITAISYALNATIMEFSFSVQVVLIAGSLHTIKVKILNRNSGIIFHKKVWKLDLAIYSRDNCYTFVRDLEQDLTFNCPFVDFFSINYLGKYFDFTLNACLVCYIGNEKYRPTLAIGNSLLNISHFIQPISSLRLYQSQVEYNIAVETVLNRINNNQQADNIKHNEVPLCSFQIPISLQSPSLNLEDLVKRLLKNCRALWRAAEWNGICKKSSFEIHVAGNIFSIEIKKDLIKLIGKDVVNCHLLKCTIFELFNENFKLNKSTIIDKKLRELVQSLELVQFNNSEDSVELQKKTVGIYKELKETVIFPLTGIKLELPQ